MAKIAFETASGVAATMLFAGERHFVVVATAGHSRVQLLLCPPLPDLHAKSFECLIGLLPVVADEAESCLLPPKDGHLREGNDLVSLVDLLVDQVPDVDRRVDVTHEWVCEQVVEQGFGRHELVGIHENDDDGLLTLQQVLQLGHCLQIFHYYYEASLW
jgi:hypothetical protein